MSLVLYLHNPKFNLTQQDLVRPSTEIILKSFVFICSTYLRKGIIVVKSQTPTVPVLLVNIKINVEQ